MPLWFPLQFSPTSVVLNGYTPGSALFAGAGGVVGQDNANFFWDVTNHRLGIGTTLPQAKLSLGPIATARAYNSFADASNGEWAYMGDWGVTPNVATYGTDANGTGIARNLQFLVGGVSKADFGISFGSDWTFVGNVRATGSFIINGTSSSFRWAGGRSQILAPADGIIELTNNAVNDFGRLQFGGTTSAFPSLKRSTTGLQVRLADDSAFAPLTAALITTSSPILLASSVALTNGAGTSAGTLANAPAIGNPTKWIPINDNGTTRYIPAW